jgi:hypothetical protein
MMSCAMTCVALWLAGATGPGGAPSAVEMKPMAITVDGPLEKETQRSCVFRRQGGGAMNVLSVAGTGKRGPENGTGSFIDKRGNGKGTGGVRSHLQ